MTVKKGWGYWKYKGEEEERNGDFNKAIELYSLAIIECPYNEDAFISRGYVKCDLREFDGAIDDFTEAIEINPRNKYGFINRAYVNLILENFEDVVIDSTKALEIDYSDKDAFLNRGMANLYLNNFDDAIQDATEAIYLDKYDKGYYIRGLAKYRKGDFNKAILDFSNAINYRSGYSKHCLFFRAVARSRNNNYEDALDDFKSLIGNNEMGGIKLFKLNLGRNKDILNDIPNEMISLIRLNIGNCF
tara:strand:+ start:2443 stop:3180 length:738 start_codon:yes stop_codon:yes gene_type:complete